MQEVTVKPSVYITPAVVIIPVKTSATGIMGIVYTVMTAEHVAL